MMDQDYQTINRMRRLSNIYRAIYRFRNANGEQIHQLGANEREIIAGLHKEGMI